MFEQLQLRICVSGDVVGVVMFGSGYVVGVVMLCEW